MAVQIAPEIESQFADAALRMGESKELLVERALLHYLEDLQDALIAEERLNNPGPRISLEELARKYGLDD